MKNLHFRIYIYWYCWRGTKDDHFYNFLGSEIFWTFSWKAELSSIISSLLVPSRDNFTTGYDNRNSVVTPHQWWTQRCLRWIRKVFSHFDWISTFLKDFPLSNLKLFKLTSLSVPCVGAVIAQDILCCVSVSCRSPTLLDQPRIIFAWLATIHDALTQDFSRPHDSHKMQHGKTHCCCNKCSL